MLDLSPVDALLHSSGSIRREAFVDNRAPAAARALLTLAHVDGELDGLHREEHALFRHLEKVQRDARTAYNDLRAQEIHIMFVESSPGGAASPDALRLLREQLEHARQSCRQLKEIAEAETSQAEIAVHDVRRRVRALLLTRQALAIPHSLLLIYQRSSVSGATPRVVPIEDGECGACGEPALQGPPNDGLDPCSACRSILYRRQPA